MKDGHMEGRKLTRVSATLTLPSSPCLSRLEDRSSDPTCGVEVTYQQLLGLLTLRAFLDWY